MLLRIIRWLIGISLLVGLAWFLGVARTMTLDTSLRFWVAGILIGFCLSMGAIALVRGFKKEVMALGLLVSLVLVGAAELFASSQVWLAQANNDCPHSENRWWPYEDHGILCTEDGRWVGHD